MFGLHSPTEQYRYAWLPRDTRNEW